MGVATVEHGRVAFELLGLDWPDWLAKIVSAVIAMKVAVVGDQQSSSREPPGTGRRKSTSSCSRAG
jgi:hypothetical protein